VVAVLLVAVHSTLRVEVTTEGTQMTRSGLAQWILGAAVFAHLCCGRAVAAEAPADTPASEETSGTESTRGSICAGSVETADIDAALASASEEKSSADRILEVLESKFGEAYKGVRRSQAFRGLVADLVKELLERNLSSADMAAKLTKSVGAACTKLEAGEDDGAAVNAAYDAAGLPSPQGGASLSAGGNDGESQYLFFLGNVNSLEADGGWKASLEASFVSVTPFFGGRLLSRKEREDLAAFGPPADSPPSKVRGLGRFELTFSEIGKIEDGEAGQNQNDGGGSTNPFQAGGGILRANLGPDVMFGANGWFGITTGIGFTTRPSNAEGADVDVRRRIFAGLLFLANYGSAKDNEDRVTGRVAIGYANDKFWKWTDTIEEGGVTTTTARNESSRWFLDARIDGPGVFQSKNVKLSARLFVDHPQSDKGPTDVRVSLLITTDLGGLFGN